MFLSLKDRKLNLNNIELQTALVFTTERSVINIVNFSKVSTFILRLLLFYKLAYYQTIVLLYNFIN